jgi:hypothetical protein
MNAGTIDSAVKGIKSGNIEPLRTLLNAMVAQHVAVSTATGVPILEPTSGASSPKPVSQPPAQASLNVDGANGSYAISITPAASTLPTTQYHEVSYSTSSNFANPVSLGVTPATTANVSVPGSTLYFRVRSSFDQTNFNAYRPATGNTAVASGLQSSAATADAAVLNQTNTASIDSVDNGTSANIRVFGQAGPGFMYPATKGSTESILPSATIINAPYSSNRVVAYSGTDYHVQPSLPMVLSDGLTPTGSVSIVGSGAVVLPTVVPIEVSGAIVAYNVTNQGNGLTENVGIAVVGSGSGATAGAQTITGGKLISVAPGNAGKDYGSGTTATVTGGVSTGSTGGGQALGGNNGRLIYNDATTGSTQ